MSITEIVLLILVLALFFVLWYLQGQLKFLEGELDETKWQRGALEQSLSQLAVGFALIDSNNRIQFQNTVLEKLIGAPADTLWISHTSGELISFLNETKTGSSGNRDIEINIEDRRLKINAIILDIDRGYRVLIVQNLEAEAIAQSRLKEFVSDASHELKTPLAALVGLLDLYESAPIDRRADLMQRINRNVHSITSLVDDLLSLSYAESGASKIYKQPCDFSKIVEGTLRDCQLTAESKGLKFSSQLNGPCVFEADPTSLKRIVLNLVENAISYTEEGSVQISLQGDDARIVLAVSDTGPGIAPEHIPKLFQRFFRVDSARSRALGGTGLGLSIVRHLVAQHNGAVNVESTLGEGSMFTVTFLK